MRCACPHCGAFMPQQEGKASCVCPDCGYECAACLGTGDQPLDVSAIRRLAALRDAIEREAEKQGE